ncbi:MAG: alpha/beta hydrolase, partial [Bryobacteraceae bacterium]
MKLTLCNGNTAYCGSIQTALDPAGEVSGLITTSFEFYPHRNAGAAAGTIVAEEGGPGYSTTGTRYYYLGLFLPLMDQRDLLLVDKRGTGKSQYINCPSLQVDGGWTFASIAACGAQLGPSSDLYGSGLAADDLAAVLDALTVDKIDLYGDSYGSYFSQAFAGRYPARLRSLVLDGAYPVAGLNPWYPELTFAMQNAFNVTCARNANCAVSAGTSMDRNTALLNYLRATPLTGSAYDGNGQLRSVSADPSSLAFLFWSNGLNQVLYH